MTVNMRIATLHDLFCQHVDNLMEAVDVVTDMTFTALESCFKRHLQQQKGCI